MAVKKVFVLANSTKKNQRCIAGREIVTNPEGQQVFGPWVRPVTAHDEGAVSEYECRLQDNCVPMPLDVVEIPCAQCENDACQPENWKIQEGLQWEKVGTLSFANVPNIAECPRDLWLESSTKSDRVTPTFLMSRPRHQSLYLVKPEGFRFFIETKWWDGYKRVRGLFMHNGVHYNFSVTDPIIYQKCFTNLSNRPDGIVQINKPDKLYICVSLTPEFNGYHYKVIATIFEEA